MFQKLMLAVTMTLALNLFLGVRLAANTRATSSYLAKIPTISYTGQH